MNKVLRFFPLNKGVAKGETKKLLITLLKYLGIWLANAIVQSILSRIPILGNLIYHVCRLVDIYCPLAMISVIIQFFAMEDDSVIDYISFDKVKGIFADKRVLIGAAIVAVALCIIPKTVWWGAKNDKKADNDTTYFTQADKNQSTEEIKSSLKKDVADSEIETSETFTEENDEYLGFDYFRLFGGVEQYIMSNRDKFPYQQVDGGTIVVFKDGSKMTLEEIENYIHNQPDYGEESIYYDTDIDTLLYNWLEWEYNGRFESGEEPESYYNGNPFDIAGKYGFIVEKVNDSESEYNGAVFAFANIEGAIDCPAAVNSEGRSIPVIGMYMTTAGFRIDNVTVPEYIQLASLSGVNSLDKVTINCTGNAYISVSDCALTELAVSESNGDIWISVLEDENMDTFILPDNGCVKGIEMYRCYSLDKVNSETSGVYNIPNGTKYIDISQNPLIEEIYLPDSLEKYNLSSNDRLKVIHYKNTDYTDLAKLQLAFGDDAVRNDNSMELEGLEIDIKNLDADDNNKDGREFSFLGQDYWQNNIYYTVWYEDGFWRVKMDIIERDIHSTGYYDSNFVYHDS